MTDTWPYSFLILLASSEEKNSPITSIPLFLAIFATLTDGSIPKTLQPLSRKPDYKMPALLPISITSEPRSSLKSSHI